jgi:hypothetical protein
LNCSNVLREIDRADEARELDEAMYVILRETLGDFHIDTVSARYNFGLSLGLTGEPDASDEIAAVSRNYARDRLAPANPRRTSMERGRPANFYIEPTWA